MGRQSIMEGCEPHTLLPEYIECPWTVLACQTHEASWDYIFRLMTFISTKMNLILLI